MDEDFEAAVKEMEAKQKGDAGSVATWGFLITALYLFVSKAGFSSLFTIRAALFLFVGMFVASVVLGNVFFYASLWIARLSMKLGDESSNKVMIALQIPFFVLQLGMCYLATKFAYSALIG
jgi:hypothetical protein